MNSRNIDPYQSGVNAGQRRSMQVKWGVGRVTAGRRGVWQVVKIISFEVWIGTGVSLSKGGEWGNNGDHA